MRLRLLALGVLLVGCASPPAEPSRQAAAPSVAPARSLAPSRIVWERDLSRDCSDEDLEVLVPFLEGLSIAHPARALPATGYATHRIAYPNVLSIPMVAWGCRGAFVAAFAEPLVEAPPVALTLETKDGRTRVELACFGSCTFSEVRAHGSWRDIAGAVRASVRVPEGPGPLGKRVGDMRYFVQRWVDTKDSPARRTDWDVGALVEHLRGERPKTLAFVYGLDWGGVDLGGRYLWSEDAEKSARRVVGANPDVLHLAWLNLRSYKDAIPALGVSAPLSGAEARGLRLQASGPRVIDQYSFTGKEMCLASREWQASRFRELEHLIAVGFRVIAVDEFPLGATWDAVPCVAKEHLHDPGDLAGEWRITREFVGRVAAFARARGVLVTSEEPSVALLPFASGYMDGMFNDPPELFDLWRKSPDVRLIPLFSAMFGASVTAYTRPGAKGDVPAGWLPQRKVPGPVRRINAPAFPP